MQPTSQDFIPTIIYGDADFQFHKVSGLQWVPDLRAFLGLKKSRYKKIMYVTTMQRFAVCGVSSGISIKKDCKNHKVTVHVLGKMLN